MKNTRTKKRNFKTRLIAAALSAITIFSVGAMSIGTASAAIEKRGESNPENPYSLIKV